MWSAVTDRPAPTAASSSAASEAVAPVLPGMAEEEADDPNEYFEPEPVDPTIDELKVSEQARRPADGSICLKISCVPTVSGDGSAFASNVWQPLHTPVPASISIYTPAHPTPENETRTTASLPRR